MNDPGTRLLVTRAGLVLDGFVGEMVWDLPTRILSLTRTYELFRRPSRFALGGTQVRLPSPIPLRRHRHAVPRVAVKLGE